MSLLQAKRNQLLLVTVVFVSLGLIREGKYGKTLKMLGLVDKNDHAGIRNVTRPPFMALRPECLEIIRQANLTNITYVHVAGNYSHHPHMGALDEWGAPNYVHNVAFLRQHFPQRSMSLDYIANECRNQDDDYKILKERILIDTNYSDNGLSMRSNSDVPRQKILCIVYTSMQNHKRIKLIRETWGQKCDGFFATSDATDTSIDAVDLLHQGPEDYGNMWQKVRSIWAYVYDHYFQDFDFFHLGGDDMYLLVENMRRYLESDEIQAAQNGGYFVSTEPQEMQVPLYLGKRFARGGNMASIYNTGGPGYTLNKAALKILVVEGLPVHLVDKRTAEEDVNVAAILRVYNVLAYDTRDEHGSERYMHFAPNYHYDYSSARKFWVKRYSIPPVVEGKNHSSPYSISFHYVRDEQMKRLYSLIYYQCPPNATLFSNHSVV
ncbi:hypothetical protein MPSEU_000589300 [Mayamaea pseudoterrestris]|nr:hypothetical protein MPSEU_000589300 [Mayamaea pseudoterrestris]